MVCAEPMNMRNRSSDHVTTHNKEILQNVIKVTNLFGFKIQRLSGWAFFNSMNPLKAKKIFPAGRG